MITYHKKYNALKVTQPFGTFFSISIKAVDLLELTFSDPLRYDADANLRGTQRALEEKTRVREISNYINAQDLAFPNTIIISANYNEYGFIEEDESFRWSFEKSEFGYQIIIPTNKKLASIIDGQHRLNGFIDASEERKMETELIVSVYFDLPAPYQAYLFASINYNQKPVNRSLALEQFGYITELTPQDSWSPELLSVFLTKKLNTDKLSILFNRIKVAPQNDYFLLELDQKELSWLVSTSLIVDGILKLITTNPKRDSNRLNAYNLQERKRSILEIDKSPLRSFYLENNDLFIYTCLINFLNAIDDVFFSKSSEQSFITKTTGISALFQVLKSILERFLFVDKDISVEYFKAKLTAAKDVDFSDNYFKSPSASGINRIYNAIAIVMHIKELSEVKNADDRENIKRILSPNLNA